jgi:hypothetical protein
MWAGGFSLPGERPSSLSTTSNPMVYVLSVFLLAAIIALAAALIADNVVADRTLKKRQTEPR